MKTFQVFDNGGESLDRYTIFKSRERRIKTCQNGAVFNAVAASKTGCGVYLHIEAVKGSHLGKRVDFSTLDKGLQRVIIESWT